MFGLSKYRSVALAVFVCCFPFISAEAQSATGSNARSLVTQNIDDGKLVPLRGNTRPEATADHDRGRVGDDTWLDHMLLQLARPSEREQELQEFLNNLQDSNSPNFQAWISPREFGERFGPSDRDLDKITDWLEWHHLQVNVVYPSGMVIDFSGAARDVARAFHIEIHNLEVNGEKHIANMSDPQIPAALSSIVVGIVSLHDFSPRAMHQMHEKKQFTFPDPYGGTAYAVVPADLATIYNLNPLFNSGNSGQGQTIALIEDTDVFSLSDWTTFRSAFGLSSYTGATITAIHPAPPKGANNCAKPGVIAPNDAEAILDGEWASAAAPSAAINMVSCKDSNTTFGGLIAVQNLLNAKAGPPPIMSISYGQCEAVNGAAANASYNSAYQQAVAEGVSVFAAAGDSGAAGCDNSVSAATSGIAANAFASTPYNVAVGGTDFSDTYSGTNGLYWNSTNSPTYGSALSYIPEIPWNDSCAGVLLSNYEGYSPTYGSTSLCNDPSIGPYLQTTVAGGGAPSACASGTPSISGVVSGTCKGWPKPSWQSVLGNPHDGVRDTPDVALFAADGLWGHYYVFCWSDTTNGGAACTGDPSGWSGAGGTSFASPIMAGIQALINQRAGARQGNPNPTYYKLAATEYGSTGNSSCNSSNPPSSGNACVFYDVTLGDMDVNCTGTHNCYLPSGTAGVLSTSDTSFAPAYGTNTGWDFASGIGSVNAANLVNNWPGVTPIAGFSLSASPSSLTIVQGATGGTSTISVVPIGNFSGSVALSASGLPSGVTASFAPTSTSTTSTLTLTASSAAALGTATVTVSGTSGTLTNTATITLTVNAPPNFALSPSPSSLSFAQGSSGVTTITVTPQNSFTGSVSLTASGLPSGVNASFIPASTTGTSTLTFAASGTAPTGSFNVMITGTSGTLSHTTTVGVTVTAAVLPPLPNPWLDQDVGSVGTAGSASYANGVFTITASGQAIWYTADGMNFAYQPLSGDGTIVARLVTLQGGYSSESSGVMIRESLDPSSTHMYAAFSQAAIWDAYRASTGGSTTGQSTPATLPYWVKLVRSGNNFSGYGSPDGINWTQIGSTQTISMAQNVYIGLAVASDNTSMVATATFDNVSVSSAAAPAPNISSIAPASGPVGTQVTISGSNFGASQGSSAVFLSGAPVTVNSWSATSITITIPSSAVSGPLVVRVAPSMTSSNPVIFTVTATPLPSPWGDQDVGPVGPAGSAAYNNGVFTINASGQYIWFTADGMNFVYQPLSGDGTIVARLVSLSGGYSSESSGVMIRETLDPGSAHMYAAFSQGAIWDAYRASTGGSTTGQSIPATLPYWVKVIRSGNNFSGYGSPDGLNWTQIGATQTITMAQNVYVGLAVSSDSNSLLATATLDNVSVSTIAAPAPSISSVSPTSGPVGTQVTITGSNFGATEGSSAVYLNGTPVTINSWSASSITITIPTGATSGPLVVTVAPSMTNSNGVPFTVSSLPSPWVDLDVGPVGLAGSASYSGGVFTINASGQYIWFTADGMNFVYQPWSGDGTIVARLVSLSGGYSSESSGVMIRETLDPSSTHMYVAFSQAAIWDAYRATTGGSTTGQSITASLPYWVKVVRSGNNFSGYGSPDGVNWTQIGPTQTITMAQNVYIGLAVSSDSNTMLATATIDNVTVQ
ncbi:MAG TPA: protease pro-enzyme activation domain-containing protein [Candidatus Acidoferrum sp.]|nr:protease pro-enzyme activation domain-containing protein [Candidatus Acidoferrum sp.]